MSIYARDTAVPVEKSRAEIEKTLRKYQADQFAYATQGNVAMIGFRAQNRMIRIVLPLPKPEDHNRTPSGRRQLSPERAAVAWEKACRQRWRALALVVKAKLEAVASDIATFEDEFMAYIVMPDGRTVSQHARPLIEKAYAGGQVGPLVTWDGAK